MCRGHLQALSTKRGRKVVKDRIGVVFQGYNWGVLVKKSENWGNVNIDDDPNQHFCQQKPWPRGICTSKL